jgi:hypothetical protein
MVKQKQPEGHRFHPESAGSPPDSAENALLMSYARTGGVSKDRTETLERLLSGIADKLHSRGQVRHLRAAVGRALKGRSVEGDKAVLDAAIRRHGDAKKGREDNVKAVAAKLPALRTETALTAAEALAADQTLLTYAAGTQMLPAERRLVAESMGNMVYKLRMRWRNTQQAGLVERKLRGEDLGDEGERRVRQLVEAHGGDEGEERDKLLKVTEELSRRRRTRAFTEGEKRAADAVLAKYSTRVKLTTTEGELVDPLLREVTVKVREARRLNNLLQTVNRKISSADIGEKGELAVAHLVETLVKQPDGSVNDLHAVAASLKGLLEGKRLSNSEETAGYRVLVDYGDNRRQSESEKRLGDQLLGGVEDRIIAAFGVGNELGTEYPVMMFPQDYAMRAFIFNRQILEGKELTDRMQKLVDWRNNTEPAADPRNKTK